MQQLTLPLDVHRIVTEQLIEAAPAAIVDDLLRALCVRLIAIDDHETGHPSHVDRVARLLRVFDASVHLPAIIYDALDERRAAALLVLALDRFAIDGNDEHVDAVAVAAERFLRAVRSPAIGALVCRSRS